MEPQKYYDFNNGVYSVHFANKQGLSIEEITEIFSEFGHVVGVTKAGDNYGYRFVRYRHEEEILRCIEGLRNHQTIKLKLKDPKKSKNQTNNKKVFSVSNVPANFNNNGPKTEFQENNNRRSFEDPAAEKSVKSPVNKTQYLNNNIPVADSRNHLLEDEKKHDPKEITKKLENLELKVQKLVEVKSTNFEPGKPSAPLRQPEVPAETFMPVYAKTSSKDNTKNSTKSSNTMLIDCEESKFKNFVDKPAIHKPDIPLVQSDVTGERIPRLVMKCSARGTEENTRRPKSPQAAAVAMPITVTAEEVVIANIHSDFGVHYILHLIQKHNPLCVSEMKIIPTLGLRYCIVYLQSLHQACAIVKEFDNFKLSGKDLIVLRPQRLAELTATEQ